MAFRTGRCTNDLFCSFASSQQNLQVPDEGNFVCPQCGKPLSDPPARAGSGAGRIAIMAAGGLTLAGGVLFAAGVIMGNHSSAAAPALVTVVEAAKPAQPKPEPAPISAQATPVQTASANPPAAGQAPPAAGQAPPAAGQAQATPAPAAVSQPPGGATVIAGTTQGAASGAAAQVPGAVPAPAASVSAALVPHPVPAPGAMAPPLAGSAPHAALPPPPLPAASAAQVHLAMLEPAHAPPPPALTAPPVLVPAAKPAISPRAAAEEARKALALADQAKREKAQADAKKARQALDDKRKAEQAEREAAAAAAPPPAPVVAPPKVVVATAEAPVRRRADPSGPSRGFSASPISGGSPPYPAELENDGRSGSVTVNCRIQEDGRPAGCHVVSARGGEPFKGAVLGWLDSGRVRYAPILKDGRAVAESHQWSLQFQPE